MSVYVDEPIDYGPEEIVTGYIGRKRARARWGHMIATTEAELHAVAQKIGLRREWHQGDHYDLVPSKRALAIKLGAIALARREFVDKLRTLPASGQVRTRRRTVTSATEEGGRRSRGRHAGPGRLGPAVRGALYTSPWPSDSTGMA